MRAAKTDVNQAVIVDGLRSVGALVQCLHRVGDGCPDLLVGFRGALTLLEVKAPGKRAVLTDDEARFHLHWHGYPVRIVTTVEEALAAVMRE